MRVLYIDCDSLRADHLGCYGYHRDTSPNIDALAAGGLQFTNCYVSDAPCLPSRTAFYTGRFGIHTGVINHGGLNADPRRHGPSRGFHYPSRFRSLLRVLADEGMHTAMISPFPPRHDAWHVLEGVAEYYDTGRSGHERADEVYPYAADWLADHATEDDWFLHVNFWDPHTEYNTPMAYGNPFADDPAPEWLTEELIEAHYHSYGPHSAREPESIGPDWSGSWDLPRMPSEIASRADFKQWVDGYDVGVHYFDHYVGKLVDLLKAQGVFDDTLIVFTADHGENLGELNVYGDHQTADEYTHHVPLVVHGPDVRSGIDDAFHYQLDLTPTIVELVGGEPPAGWDGQSFAETVTDGVESGREYLVLSQGAWACQRAVRWGRWLFARTYHDGFKAALDEYMLFDLEDDPHETTNLADERPDVVSEGLSRLQRWVDDRLLEAARGENGGNPESPGGTSDPMWDVIREGGPLHTRGNLEPYAKRLRETGRAEHAAELERRHG